MHFEWSATVTFLTAPVANFLVMRVVPMSFSYGMLHFSIKVLLLALPLEKAEIRLD